MQLSRQQLCLGKSLVSWKSFLLRLEDKLAHILQKWKIIFARHNKIASIACRDQIVMLKVFRVTLFCFFWFEVSLNKNILTWEKDLGIS